MDRGQRPEGARVVVLPKVEIRHGVTGSLLRRKLNSRHRATTRSFRDGVRIYNMQCCSERDVLGCDNKFWQVWAHRYRFRQIQIQRGTVFFQIRWETGCGRLLHTSSLAPGKVCDFCLARISTLYCISETAHSLTDSLLVNLFFIAYRYVARLMRINFEIEHLTPADLEFSKLIPVTKGAETRTR